MNAVWTRLRGCAGCRAWPPGGSARGEREGGYVLPPAEEAAGAPVASHGQPRARAGRNEVEARRPTGGVGVEVGGWVATAGPERDLRQGAGRGDHTGDGGVGDGGEHLHAASAAGANQEVLAEHAAEELGPGQTGRWSRRRAIGARVAARTRVRGAARWGTGAGRRGRAR
jgi:hypothetical protein